MKPFRLTPPSLRENDIERACLDLLRLRGYFVVRIHSGLFRSADGQRWITGAEKGTADYIAVHKRHRGFLLETKRPTLALTEAQRSRAAEILAGYGVPTVTAASARALRLWLDQWETQPRRESA